MGEVYVKVRPECEEFSVELGDFPLFFLESEASRGRANSELVRRVEEITGERPAIISGHRSRRKKLKLDMDKQEFEKRLKNYDG
ncbi:MAG: hypothetical protein ABEJ87_00735 [Candidatus Nanohalobium sp.]